MTEKIYARKVLSKIDQQTRTGFRFEIKLHQIDELKTLLIKRLPALMAKFRQEINAFFGEEIIISQTKINEG